MKYSEVKREKLIEMIEEKDKLIQELTSMKAEFEYQASMDLGKAAKAVGANLLERVYKRYRNVINILIPFLFKIF